MATRLRISPFLRRAAVSAAFGALLIPAAAGAATAEAAAKKKVKLPVVTGVKPMNVAVGEVLEIRGRNFVRGRNRNTVVFKRDGGKAVFIKASVGTAKLLKVTIPASLQKQFALSGGAPKPTRFRLRILAKKFGKSFTRVGLSPTVSAPRPPVPPGFVESQPDGDCDGDGAKNKVDGDDDNDGLTDAVEQSLNLNPCVADTDSDGLLDRWEYDCDQNGVLNRDEDDDDKDLLPDSTENTIGTDSCNNDTDADGIEDGFEFQSARDLNDDEYQEANQNLPYPGPRPYPNPLFKDGDKDWDGDSLTQREEQALWHYTYNVAPVTATRTLTPLSYSDGEQYSIHHRGADGRRVPDLSATNYAKHDDFTNWTGAAGYRQVYLQDGPWAASGPASAVTNNYYGLYDIDRSAPNPGTANAGEDASETLYYDLDGNNVLSDDERDEDSDGLSNYEETHGRLNPEYWKGCYTLEKPYMNEFAGTDVAKADTDGDGIRDGADDQDHDDIPNLMELSRYAASNPHLNDNEAGFTCKPADGLPEPPATWHPDEYGRVNPFNPCLPARFSRTCPHIINGSTGAPFDGSPNWYSLN